MASFDGDIDYARDPLSWGQASTLRTAGGSPTSTLGTMGEDLAESTPLTSSPRRPLRAPPPSRGESVERGLPVGTVLWVLCVLVAVVLVTAVLLGRALFRTSEVPTTSPEPGVEQVEMSRAVFCLKRTSGKETFWDPDGLRSQPTSGTLKMPEGDYTVLMVFQTSLADQTLLSFGPQCPQLLLTAEGHLELRQGGSGEFSQSRFHDPARIPLADGKQHAVSIAWKASRGGGQVTIDHFPSRMTNNLALTEAAARRRLFLSEDGEACRAVVPTAFVGDIEAFRVFDWALDTSALAQEDTLSCKLHGYTTTETTTSLTTTSTTQTSTQTTTTLTVTATSTATTTSTTHTTRTITKTETATTTTQTTETTTSTTLTTTSITTTSLTTTTRTRTRTTTPPAVPMFTESFFGKGVPNFPGATLPPTSKGMTLVAWIMAEGKGSRQEVISFGNADPSSDGCVSLLLSESGSLVYRERAIGISAAWATVETSLGGHDLFDGAVHSVAVARTGGDKGLAYVFVDGTHVGQGVFEAGHPAGFASTGAWAKRTCGMNPADDGAIDGFKGKFVGLRIFDVALTKEQISWHQAPS